MAPQSTFTLGPLAFRTSADAGFTEALGDAIEVVGAALTAADPTPKPFNLALPVGWAGEQAYEQGLRARRQVRGLLNNAQARMQGFAFAWTVDPEWRGWMLVGGGTLEPGDAGGISHGEWLLRLNGCFVVARAQTHRAAIQASVIDVTRGDAPVDVKRTRYSTDFAWCATRSRVALGRRYLDPTTSGRPLAFLEHEAYRNGLQEVVEDVEHGQVISFEFVGDRLEDSVAILDRRGSAVEADWERVFGPDHPLTQTEAPTLDNGFCRTRWLTSGALALDAWNGTVWEERGRLLLPGTFVSTRVEEWTPEKAVVAIVTQSGSSRLVTYATLQRGWHGPSFERYGPPGNVQLTYVSVPAGRKTVRIPAAAGLLVHSGNPLPDTTIASFSAQNWVELDDGSAVDAFAVRRAATTVRLNSSTYSGLSGLRSNLTFSASDHVGVRIDLRRTQPDAGARLGAFALVDAHAVPTFVTRT